MIKPGRLIFNLLGFFVFSINLKQKEDFSMAWIYLIIAGFFEIVWAIGLKYTHGFTKLFPSVVTIIGMIISFYYLALATKTLPIGTGYAVWTGIGAVGTVILGIFLFNESRDISRLFFLLLIVIGIIGLKFSSSAQ